MPEIEDITETTETAQLFLWWQWAIFLIIAFAVAYLVSFLLKNKVRTKPKVDNLKSALRALRSIQQKNLEDTALATELSILTRSYLRSQLNNQSLFQTHQEFVKDEEDLERLPPLARKEVQNHLEKLSNHKYLPNNNLPAEKESLIEKTECLLRTIHSNTL